MPYIINLAVRPVSPNCCINFVFLFTSWHQVPAEGEELLKNPDFEDDLAGNWWCNYCKMTRMNEGAMQGDYCVKVTGRTQVWHGGGQALESQKVQEKQYYYFTAHVKIASDETSTMGYPLAIKIKFNFGGTTRHYIIGSSPYMRRDRGWVRVGGDFYVRQIPSQKPFFYFQSNNVKYDYLVDTASLTQVVRNPNWVEEADARIDYYRKQFLEVRVITGENYDPANVEVAVSLRRHHFAFGSAIVADRISGTSPQDQRFQEVFYENFEWAVFENDMNWKEMEGTQYSVSFDRVDSALAALKANDITVRGHSIFMGASAHVPVWLADMSGEQVLVEMQRRMDYLLQRYENDIVHWDVYNEQLRGAFFEKKLDNVTIMEWMFKEAHRQIPDTLLMLNDYGIVAGIFPDSTVEIVNVARELQERDVPVHGIGVQSHFYGAVDPDIVSKRLDIVAEAGLPIWVTELDVTLDDREERADAYENALRLYLSRPEIQGVLIWGFWDVEHWRPDAALWEGEEIVPNAEGLRWMQLVKGEWATNETLHPTAADETFRTRAFQGLYSVDVRYNGTSICRRTEGFDVPVGQDASWTINVQEC